MKLAILGQYLPNHVGIPIGGRTGAKYYMLEIHYDNPKAHRGKCHKLQRSLATRYSKRFAADGAVMLHGSFRIFPRRCLFADTSRPLSLACLCNDVL